ncbi:MAG TPA: GMC family oxidoreductase N-terminal domain-containing protein [Acidimicrobiia bacterium]|nr:GMC family oxidoreductase N-terminal domain-containing protein [Acidimicrobiia bacterium]
MTRPPADRFDYVVVGGGSAGCVVAGRLAAAGATVAVLEAGGTDRRPDVWLPAGVVSAYKLCNWKYVPEPDRSRGGLVESWPAGRILGGTGSINGTVFVRGNRADFDGWAAAGCPGWDHGSVLPYFRRLETWAGPPHPDRGTDGPIHVGYHAMPHPAADRFLAAAVEAGHPRNADYNAAVQEGVAVVQVNQRRGVRSQSSRGHLRRLPGAERITVLRKAFVERIVFDGRGRATGVEYRHAGRRRLVRAGREVVLSAGTLASPKILMLSGVGPKGELDRHGLPVVCDSPGVGSNLRDHIGALQRWHTTVPTVNELGPVDGARAVAEYARRGSGPLAAVVFQVQVILRTRPELARPDIQLAFASFGIVREQGPDGMMKVEPAKQRSVMVTTALLQPRTSGRLRLRSTDPAAPPVIDYEMLADPADVTELMAGMAEARRIMAQPAIADIVGPPFEPERGCRGDDDWRAWVRSQATYGVHYVGTCRMGRDDFAVVDPELRVRGVDGLRVVDASVMPTTTSGNTNAPTMMIAERAADLILGS